MAGKKTNLKSPKSKTSTKNREFAVITYLFVGIFICLMGYFVYFQVVRSEDVINSPYNKRQDTFVEHVVRGEIKSADQVVLAQTVTNEDGTQTRYYPYGGMFAHALGYDSNGKSGIESFANFSLLRSHAFYPEQIVNGIQNEKNPGDNVVTTLDYQLQEIAYNALGANKGAVVAMEPSTGKILAMVSKPDFNPNSITADWEAIVSDDTNSVLLNRVTQGLYPPGSIFKIFTLLEYIQEHTQENLQANLDYSYNCMGSITVDDTTINCYNGAVHGEEDLITSFAKSCNGSFAKIGLGLEQDSFAKLCNSLLFNADLPTSYPYKGSSFVLDHTSSEAEIMQTAIGQGKTLVTPLHMELITCAIANRGIMMRPYIIDHTENYNGVSVKEYAPLAYGTFLKENEYRILQEYMEYVVTNGTGSKLNGGNYTAAGKTGSAEYNNTKGDSHAWFTGYAYQESGEIAVTVIVEGGGAGSETAVPIARQLFDAYFNR
ncbi:penicillin-binding protein 2 [Lachnospiraceae bacterium ZAX-1]